VGVVVLRSSTPSSRIRHGLQLAIPVTVVLAGLFVAEALTRFAVAGERLPSPDAVLWHRREVDVKLRQMQALEADGPIDVLFVGSSVTYTGVDPALFDSVVEAKTGQPAVSYNAGLAALPVSMVEAFVKGVFFRYTSPETIILLLTPRDVNRNNSYNQIMVEEVLASAYGKAWLSRGIEARATQLLLEHSALFRYRNWVILTALNGWRVPLELPVVYDDPQFDSRGYVTTPARMTDRLVNSQAPGQEVATVSLRAFDPSGKDMAALERLIRNCRDRGIQFIVVNMPMNHYLASSFEDPAADYDRYSSVLTALVERYRVPFWDADSLSQGNSFADDDFSDIFHLNTGGAQKLTRFIAERYSQIDH
jgi:hypothetical protein